MIECIIRDRRVDEVVAIVRELRTLGLEQGRDFDFKWEPAILGWLGDTEETNKTIFTFYSEEYATMFELKYQ